MKLFKYLKEDSISGFLVFLIALPLSLGIAKASGFPPIAGIYSAIIGGVLVTFFTNSQLTIKGPAAGLIVIAIGAVDELGAGDHIKGYELTLAVIVVSGIIQIGLGIMKSGKLGDFFPASVIHGMLAAIGIIIMSKQIHVLMGVVPISKKPFDLILEIPHSLSNMNPQIAMIGAISILILFFFPLIKNQSVSRIPAPLVVLVAAIPLGFYFDLSHEHDYDLGQLHYHINPKHLLVALPDNFFGGITSPDFSEITTSTSIKYIIMFALVGSIESLLSAKAIDTMDPKNRKSNLNKDLVAVGIGNTFLGFIGGLPIISEIVRSSANINNGGKTKMSNFFHGLFLFLFALLATSLIQKIPMAALSAMLVYTGFKLSAPIKFAKVKEIGYDQLLLFLTTLIVTIITDLLIGVAVGILLKFVIHLTSGVSIRQLLNFKFIRKANKQDDVVTLYGTTTFINYLKFKNFIDNIEKSKIITLDFSKVKLIDHTFLENLHHVQNDFAREGGQLLLSGFENHHFQSLHHLSSRRKVRNPKINKANDSYSRREKDLQNIASKYGFEFQSTVVSGMVRPYLRPFSILPLFRTVKNLIVQSSKNYNILVCDISYEQVGNFTLGSKLATIAVIHNLDIDLPDFYIEKEGFIKNLKTKYDFFEIELSKKISFELYGNDKEKLKNFFNDETLHLIENHNYIIESKNQSILIQKDFQKISTLKDMEAFVKFSQELCSQIVIKK